MIAFDELDALRARGREWAAEHPGELDARADSIDEDDLFTFIYTSGTTGPPKACMIRHRNYYAMVQKSDEMEDRLLEPGDVMLLYLPLAHNYGRLLHLSAAYHGFTIAFLPDPLRAAAELPRVRPTIFPSVPRVYEKIHAAVLAGFDERDRRAAAHRRLGARRRPARVAAASGEAAGPAPARRAASARRPARLLEGEGAGSAAGCASRTPAARRSHARSPSSSTRSTSSMLEGYGLSEVTTAATVNRPSAFKFGTVGRPLPGVELRIAEDGEILIRSNTVFAGYYHDEEATRATIDDEGFVHTGDVGHIDEDGFLVITDRKKDIIVTAGGKNVAPQNLENELKAHRVDLAGARRRRPQAVHRRARHARPGRDERHAGRRGAEARCRRRSTR